MRMNRQVVRDLKTMEYMIYDLGYKSHYKHRRIYCYCNKWAQQRRAGRSKKLRVLHSIGKVVMINGWTCTDYEFSFHRPAGVNRR